MKTFIYMVRHGDSPKEGDERTRGLTDKGKLDAHKLTDILIKEDIDAVISSPYDRSILTVQPLAEKIGSEVLVHESFKERMFTVGGMRISDKELYPLLETSFSDAEYALEGAESNAVCQRRSVKVLKDILTTYEGQKVVIGTHGAVMTLMMNHYDSTYDMFFLLNTSKPDIYRMEFDGQELKGVTRLWKVRSG
ncbi:histidine phosphatase family protein [Falsibacillus albus]|uniref:Histidine phosphatase family protein n=1 Tax=Falsibacillus albus TaxID=2478915 RepID=A0A3L7JPP9_9BACI|nr:histidine phosphatase family protein [Falsibacillus albus]RLQ92304.1 histidine phosphatase family protein [Falsibacillus albus]